MPILADEWESATPINTEWEEATPVSKEEWDAAAPIKSEENFMQKTAPYVRPVLEFGGMAAGGAVGSGVGPAGTIAGAAGGYAMGKEAANLYDQAVGVRKSENLLSERGALSKVAETGQNLVEGAGLEMTGGIIGKSAELVAKSPFGKYIVGKILNKPTPEAALGQVLQGKTKDMAKGKRAFGAIDTTGSKTYADLSKKIDDAIPNYAKLQDAELLKDPKIYKLDELVTKQKTQGGVEVTNNFVKDALENLKELYGKTKDLVKAGNIDELIIQAETKGLTKKEVNDIARVYGSEYNAFSSSSGEALTSVNKQAYENTRKGLKEVSRRGLDSTAKELDTTMSALLNTRRLMDKNVEAANRLRQKVDERGLGEKIGRGLLVAMDWATLGTVKGAALKALPRGLGYKVKNYIDLEEALTRNLKIINEGLVKHGGTPVESGVKKVISKTLPYTVASSMNKNSNEQTRLLDSDIEMGGSLSPLLGR